MTAKVKKTVQGIHKKLRRVPSRTFAIVGVLVFAAIGTVLLVSSKAATPVASFEAEAGTRSGSATQVSDAAASGGSGVKFAAASSQTTCPPYPQFPDADCTGPTGTLTTYTGSMSFNTPGQVVENVIINTTGITINADNVTFRNCKIVYTGSLDGNYGLVNLPVGTTGTKFERCELDGQGKVPRVIRGDADITVDHCDIHSTGNGIEVATKITMTNTYMHDIVTAPGTDWHADGVQSWDSAEDITIVHNTILLTGGETGAINIVSNGGGGTFRNILVQNNLMAGGGYTVYAGTAPARTINFRVIDNHFSKMYYPKVGYYNIWYPTYFSSVVRTGNVIHETGAAANDNI